MVCAPHWPSHPFPTRRSSDLGAMSRPGHVVNPDVRRIRQIFGAVDRRVPQRTETTLVPVFGACVEHENLRLETGGYAHAEAIPFTGHRIRRHLILKWKLRLVEDAQRIHARETLVESTDAGASGLHERCVERL